MTTPASFETAPTASSMPDWYPDLLASVAIQISTGRFRAVTAANQELVRSYWSIGHELLARESEEGWGSKVVTRLSTDLQDQFPEARGFSPRNLRYMKTFAAALPWSHHVLLLEKLNTPEERLWYMACAIDEGWSHSVLGHQIETRLRERAGRAITNFKATLPPSDSDLAQQSFNDPYVFDFVSMTGKRNERELEGQLVVHVEKFLLELGQGFAFVGRQVRLTIGDGEFFADLLFYNFKLRCFCEALRNSHYPDARTGSVNVRSCYCSNYVVSRCGSRNAGSDSGSGYEYRLANGLAVLRYNTGLETVAQR